MRRLYPFLKGIWILVVLGLTLGLISNWLADKSVSPQQVTLTKVIPQFLRDYGLWILLVLVPLSLLTLYAWWDNHRHRTHFDLYTSARKLRPENLSFLALSTTTTRPTVERRPHYAMYVPRKAVPCDGASGAIYSEEALASGAIYSEGALAAALMEGSSVLLFGPPLAGKTRTLYEVIKLMEGYRVLKPKRDASVPDEDDFAFVKGRNIILLLDNLDDYAGYDLTTFRDRVQQRAACVVVAATCSTGSELDEVRTTLRKFYINISLKLELRPMTAEDKDNLAKGIGKELDPNKFYPTPGSITMERSIDAMRERFVDLPAEQQDILRALRLLFAGGVRPYTHRRLHAIVSDLLHRDINHLGDSLDSLAKLAFLYQPGHSDPIRPELAYLRDAVTYVGHKRPEDDFATLADVLEGLSDVDGLLNLAITDLMVLRDRRQALATLERAIRLRPDHADAWHYKGLVLRGMGRYPEALTALERAIRLRPDHADAWHYKGTTLGKMRRHSEALAALEQAIRLRPDDADAWNNKGAALRGLGRYWEALAALEQAIRLYPDHADAWFNKGVALRELGRHPEALAVFEQTIRLRPDDVDIWHYKGVALCRMGRYGEGLAVFEQIIQLRPDDAGTWLNKGAALCAMIFYPEALAALEQAIRLRPDDADAWHNKGAALGRMHRHSEALTAIEQTIRLRPDYADAWRNKGAALHELGRDPEALAAYKRAIRLHPDDVDTWIGKRNALRGLGRSREAIVADEHALILDYLHRVWNEGDVTAPEQFVANDVMHHDPAPVSGDICGPEGIARLVTDYRAAFPDLYIVVDDMIAKGHEITVHWTMHGTHQGDLTGIRATGKPVVVTGISIYRMANGKIAEVWQSWNHLALVQETAGGAPRPRNLTTSEIAMSRS